MNILRHTGLILCILLVCAPTGWAQKRKDLQPPKVILVQLKSEMNRINYYEKKKDVKKAELLKRQADTIARLMIQDFEENFKYCPVYYFYDTNAKLIRGKRYAGVLLDKERHPVSNIAINAADSNEYYIATFGHSLPLKSQPNTSKMGKGLVIVDHNYKAMEPPFPHYIYRLARLRRVLNDEMPKGWYESRQFDIEYFPVAERFSSNLSEFFR